MLSKTHIIVTSTAATVVAMVTADPIRYTSVSGAARVFHGLGAVCDLLLLHPTVLEPDLHLEQQTNMYVCCMMYGVCCMVCGVCCMLYVV